MGCETCKIETGNDAQIFIENSRQLTNSKHQYLGLLTFNDRQIWIDNLPQPDQPDQIFLKSNLNTPHTCFAQIKKDIVRTFTGDTFFSSKTNLQRFQNLLQKFALYFPKVGYTQGLNFLAGYLLIAGFDDGEAFKILVRLALNQKLLLIGLYEDKFPLNRLYCSVFWKLLEKRQPNTALKIKLANVPDQIWIFQWFMTCFLYSFPVQFIKKFFDYIVCKKQFAMVCLALGIVNCLKTDINNLTDPDEFDFYELIDKLKNGSVCEQKISIQKVINYANSVTKLQICKALDEIKMPKNIYYTYFRRENQRSQIWRDLNQKFKCERRIFQTDPRSSQYTRDLNSVEHLERLLLKKSRLFRSRADSRFSSQIRTSNYTVDFDISQDILSQKPMNIQQNGRSERKIESAGFFAIFGKYDEYGGILQGPSSLNLPQKKTFPQKVTNNVSKDFELNQIRTKTREDTFGSRDSKNKKNG